MIFETIASNDPRLDSEKIKFIDKFWLYSIAEIKEGYNTEWLKGTEITRDQAYAHHWTNALNNEVAIMQRVSDPADIVQPTSFGDPDYEKVNYSLSADDKTNAVTLMKAAMRLHANKYCENKTQRDRILASLNTVSGLEETQTFMATYFEWDCAYTNGKTKNPEFEVEWSPVI